MTWWAVVNNDTNIISAIHKSRHHPGELPVPCPEGSRAVKMSERISARVGWICLDGAFYDQVPSPEDIRRQHEILRSDNRARKRELMVGARERIEELQDMIALDLASEAQKASVLLWRQHRMEVRKVEAEDTDETLDWPEPPQEANETDIEPIVT